jgi:DNA excision repair protein ERCC-2
MWIEGVDACMLAWGNKGAHDWGRVQEVQTPSLSGGAIIRGLEITNVRWCRGLSANLPLSYFPYPTVRRYQDLFMKVIYEAIMNRQHVAIAAASGLGKTIGVLSAALPFARDNGLRILYIARTHKECDRAIEELKVINRFSTQVSGISIRSRSEACLNRLLSRYALDATTAMEICGELKKRHSCRFFERLRSRRKDFGAELRRISVQPLLFSEVVEVCRRQGVCPYEFAKLLVGKVDVAAMSYNYLLHDEIRQTLLKSLEYPLSSYILVMDEAHNLPEAAVNIASEKLSVAALRRAEWEAKKYGFTESYKFLTSVRRAVDELQVFCTRDEDALPGSVLIKKIVEDYGGNLDSIEGRLELLHDDGEAVKRKLLEKERLPRSSVHHVADFLLKWLGTCDKASYLHLLSKWRGGGNSDAGDNSFLEVICLDPEELSSHVLSEVYSSISMSGTLEPIDCYVDILGLPPETKGYLFNSPFPKENIKIVICRGVTTSLTKRSREMYEKLSLRIAECVNSTPVNTGVFAASYEVLHGLIEAGLKNLLQKPSFVETSDSTSSRNDELVEQFRESASSGGGALLGVQGGRNSEGLDLPGDLLDTVVVVGVPYAKPTARVRASVDYYETKFPKKGKEYGYDIPAVRKAAQAAGRAFRSLDDRGAVVFLDQRFSKPPCIRLLPSWIRESCAVLPDEDGVISLELQNFYASHCSSKG